MPRRLLVDFVCVASAHRGPEAALGTVVKHKELWGFCEAADPASKHEWRTLELPLPVTEARHETRALERAMLRRGQKPPYTR